MSEPTVQDASKTKPDPSAEEQARREFVKARDRRNKMIALGLVAFAALLFTITAIRLYQNTGGAAG